jgi:hypothetical protein
MRLFGSLPVMSRRTVVALGVTGMLFSMASVAQAQEPPPTPPPAAAAAPAQPEAPDPFKFDGSKPAMLMIQVKPGNEATFEAALTAVKAKLGASDKPNLPAQAATLNLLKLDAPPTEGQPVIYVIYLESPTAGVSYNIQNMLDSVGEWTADSELYKQFSTAIHMWAPWPLNRK